MPSLTVSLIAIVALVATAYASCTSHCYAGSINVDAERQLDFAFTLLPCAPTRVLHSSFVLDGQILSSAGEPKLVCETSGELAAISVSVNPHTRLSWNYETTDDCATVLANIAMPGIFKGTAHELNGVSVFDGADLSDSLTACSVETCKQLNYTSGQLTLTGEAMDKSPCGAEGTQTCNMEIVFKTRGECSPGASAADVYDLEVFVQPDGVKLSLFQPAALTNAQLLCVDGELTLQADGLMVDWPQATDNAADCASVLADLSTLASRNAATVAVALSDDEIWLSQSAPSIRAGSASSAGQSDSDDDGEQPVEPNLVYNATSISWPVEPTLHCNVRFSDGYCCSVFGFRNRNLVPVVIPRIKGSNWFLPSPHIESGAPMTFPANTTVAASFSVIWPCHQFLQHFKTWSLKTRANFDHRVWERQVVSNRERIDCSDDDITDFCEVDGAGGVTRNEQLNAHFQAETDTTHTRTSTQAISGSVPTESVPNTRTHTQADSGPVPGR